MLGIRLDIGLSLLASKGVIRVVVCTRLLYFSKTASRCFNQQALLSIYIGPLMRSNNVLLKRSTNTAFKSELDE